MVAIPALLIFVFSYIPMVGIIIAFKKYRFADGIFGSRWVGFDNFNVFVRSDDFMMLVRNTLGLNLLCIVAGIVASVLLALLLFELKSRTATKVYQTLLITPYFLSWVIVGYMAYGLLNPEYGMINTFLKSIGMTPIQWYSEPKYWPGILTVASIWKNFGLDSVIYYAALMGVDATLFEAAEIDGANKFQRTIHIIFPSLLPLVSILTILKIGGIFAGDIGLFYQLTRNVGALRSTTDIISTYVLRSFTDSVNISLLAAIGLLQSVLGFVLVIITNYFSKKIDPNNGIF